jgi:sugar diacid utilization regulator
MVKDYIKVIENLFKVKIEKLDKCNKEEMVFNLGEHYFRVITDDEETFKKVKAIVKYDNYVYESQLLKQAKENFINDLIHKRFDSLELMLNRSEILGFDFYSARRAILVLIEDMYILFKDKNEMVLQKFKEEFYETALKSLKDKDNIASYIGENKFLICQKENKGEDSNEKMAELIEDIKRELGLTAKIAVGDSYEMPGLEAMSYSFQDCERYMELGRKYLQEKNIYDFKEVGIYIMYMNMDNFQKKKIQGYVADIMEYGEKNRIDIKKFLESYFKNKYSVSKAEIESGISKNKGKIVIAEIEKLTGLDPSEFENALKFYMALKIWRR